MALIMDITTDFGIEVKSTYARVIGYNGTKLNCYFQVAWYVAKATSDNGGIAIQVKNYNYVPNLELGSVNFIKQAYVYLKTLDEFKSGVDA